MDIATKLFSFSLGVEPNKATLKELSDTLNSAVLSLAEKQKALEKYAETAQSQSFVVEAPPPKHEAPKQKPPVVWQISQAKLKELQWKRAQLRQFQREKTARSKSAQSKAPSPQSSQGKPPSKPSPTNQSSTQGLMEKSRRINAPAEVTSKSQKTKPKPVTAQAPPVQPQTLSTKAQSPKIKKL